MFFVFFGDPRFPNLWKIVFFCIYEYSKHLVISEMSLSVAKFPEKHLQTAIQWKTALSGTPVLFLKLARGAWENNKAEHLLPVLVVCIFGSWASWFERKHSLRYFLGPLSRHLAEFVPQQILVNRPLAKKSSQMPGKGIARHPNFLRNLFAGHPCQLRWVVESTGEHHKKYKTKLKRRTMSGPKATKVGWPKSNREPRKQRRTFSGPKATKNDEWPQSNGER